MNFIQSVTVNVFVAIKNKCELKLQHLHQHFGRSNENRLQNNNCAYIHRRHLPGGFVPGGGGGEWVPKEKPIKKKIIFSYQKYVES